MHKSFGEVVDLTPQTFQQQPVPGFDSSLSTRRPSFAEAQSSSLCSLAFRGSNTVAKGR
jgi:hypothetical protein